MEFLPCPPERIRLYFQWFHMRIRGSTHFSQESENLVSSCFQISGLMSAEELENIHRNFWSTLRSGLDLLISETTEGEDYISLADTLKTDVDVEQMIEDLDSVEDWLQFIAPA